jgi:hypothetical protein
MKQLEIKSVLRRFNEAKKNKELWRTRLRDCYEYAYPEGNLFDKRSPGQDTQERVYDSTAINALQRYANKMVMQLIPPTKKWIALEAGSDVAEGDEERINQQLSMMTDILFENISNSNLVGQAQQAFLDAGISTGAIIQEDGDGIDTFLNYRAVPTSELVLEKSRLGLLQNVYREFEIPAGDLDTTFPKGAGKWGDDIIRKQKDTPHELITLIEGEIKDESVDAGYYSFLIIPDQNRFVYQVKQEVSSWVIFREQTMAGEVYGRGRVMRAIKDIKTLNERVKFMLISDAYNAPIFTAADDGIFNTSTIKVNPATTIPVDSNDNANPTIRQLNVNSGTPIQMEGVRYYQSIVDKALLDGVFGDIEETPVRTATEMQIRQNDNSEATAAATGNFLTEFVRPIVDGAIYRLKKAGKIANIKADGKLIKVKYMSPASRMQDSAQLQDMVTGLQMILTGLPEQSHNAVKWNDVPKEIFNRLNLPLNLLKSKEEMEMEQLKQQQQMMQMQQAEQQAQADSASQIEMAKGEARAEQELARGMVNGQ